MEECGSNCSIESPPEKLTEPKGAMETLAVISLLSDIIQFVELWQQADPKAGSAIPI
jgi:hypothetical protein